MAQGTLFNTLQLSIWEKNLKENRYMYEVKVLVAQSCPTL